ncbi:MAG: metallophosphoesterase family protein [Thermoproteales archaeon]|nr:metallophosphoesterase family protein [Thermoproteales archaeon]
MKILHVTDMHGDMEVLQKLASLSSENYDLVVATGDYESIAVIKAFKNFKKPVLAVTGNMDSPLIASELKACSYSIENKIVKIGKYYFAGIGGRALYSSIVGVASKLYEMNTPKPLILISHYPPVGVKVDLAWTGIHIGKSVIREIVEKFKPILLLCGHVHEARGIDKLGDTILVNPGPLYMGFYAIIDAEKLEIEMKRVSC